MKTTKRTLSASIISLIICLVMFIGTTFAWFTDSVTSGNNIIASGNLQVELYHNGGGQAEKVTAETKLFSGVSLWEPGAVAYENLTVENVGSLALNYDLSVNCLNENTVSDGENTYSLSQILQVAVVNGGVDTELSREEMLSGITEWQSLESFVKSGYLLPADKATAAEPASASYGVVIYWKPTADDNNWNVNNGKITSDGEALSVELGAKLTAYQYTYEEDSFGNDYDASAEYSEESKLTKGTDGLYYSDDPEDGNAYILDTESMLAFASAVTADENYFAGRTAVLGDNIDLTSINWTPIENFAGTFDGADYSVTVALEVKNGYAGLFNGVISTGTVQNLTLNGTIKLTEDDDSAYSVGGTTSHYVGMIAVNNGTVSNCVNNANITVEYQNKCGYTKTVDVYCGGIAGANVRGTLSSCVNNASVKINGAGSNSSSQANVGGIAGQNHGSMYGGSKAVIDGCTNNGDISADDTMTSRVGGITGCNYTYGSQKAYVYNCSNSGNISCDKTGAYSMAGGLVAWNKSAYLYNSFNTGSINGVTGRNIGGIVGYFNYGTAENCYNVGTVTGGTNNGGICGSKSGGTVKYCYCLTEPLSKSKMDSSCTLIDGELLSKLNTYASANGYSLWKTSENSDYPVFE